MCFPTTRSARVTLYGARLYDGVYGVYVDCFVEGEPIGFRSCVCSGLIAWLIRDGVYALSSRMVSFV